MEAGRLKQIEEIYHAALKIPLEKRKSFFAEFCGVDEDLRHEVESLLSFEKTSGNFLDSSPETLAAEMFAEKDLPIDFTDKEIGHYKVLKLLGKGGMGAVYLAQDSKLLRSVALKILPSEMVGDKNRVQRFVHEARAASALNHPHILTIYDVGKFENLNFIAMEFVDGETFHDLIYQGKTDLETLIKYLAQAADGLSKAHSAGIVHRDLKPENIMVTRDGFAKILDFGLAKLVEAESDLQKAQEHQSVKGMILGTLGYMSPEQARGLPEIDTRSDIFSFGCLLYEAVARRKPFVGGSTVETLHKIISDEPAPFVASENLREIINLCLKKSPAERFQTIAEVADLLRKADLKTDKIAFSDESPTLINFQNAAKTISKSISEQRRQATILFAELSALNEMLEDLEPEEASRILNDLLAKLGEIVRRGNGQIEKRLSDTFVAVWGTNSISEEDPERAIRTALLLQNETNKFVQNSGILSNSENLLKIGISTGTILLGQSSDTGNFLTSGIAVNTAKRLQKNASGGEIFVSQETYRHVRGVFDVDECSLPNLKNKDAATKIYQIKSVKSRAFRLGKHGVEGIETKIVGRSGELEKMRDALLSIFEDGEMQILTVVGDAGLGKSRLLFEFRDAIEIMPEKVRVFNARATETMRGLPYSLVKDLFSFRCEILDNDAPKIAREKLVKCFADLWRDQEIEMKTHFIGQLIGFDFSDSPHIKPISSDLQQIHTRGLRYAAEFFSTISKEITTVVYLDDLHWADQQSLDFFEYVSRHCIYSPILILEFSRPSLFENRPHWGEGQRHRTRLNLSILSKSESRKLVEDILQKMSGGVPTKLRDLIVSNAEGNPFYVEELIKMLIDRQTINTATDEWIFDENRLEEMPVPTTLNGVLQARLDKLAIWEKIVLQRASIIGREFWDKAVENFGAEVNVKAVLESLRNKELLYRHENSAFGDANEYLFKHALLRDATYETVLLDERRALHEKTANWLINESGERAVEYAATIAAHFEKSRQINQSAEWFGRAGEQSFNTHAADSAIVYYQKALDFAAQNEAETPLENIFKWQRGLGIALWTRAKFDDALKNHLLSLKTAEKIGDKVAQSAVWTHLSICQLERGENRTAIESAAEAVRLAREAGESEAARLQLATALFRYGRSHWSFGKFAEIMAIGEEALQIVEEYGEKGLNEKGLCFHLLAVSNYALGRFKQAVFYVEQEIHIGKMLGNKRAYANALNSLGEILRFQGDFESALTYFDEAIANAREIGNKSSEIMILSNMGGALVGAGEYEKADSHLQNVIEIIGDKNHFSITEVYYFLAEALLGQNKSAEALAAAITALDLSEKAENQETSGEAWRVLGLISAKLRREISVNGELYNASKCFKNALQIFSEIKMDAALARTLRSFARFENKQGDSQTAQKLITEAKEIFTRLEMPIEFERSQLDI